MALAQFKIDSKPPEGFESLTGPQTTLVDIVYGGVMLGTTNATFTQGSLWFEDPELIVKSITDITDPRTVKEALSGPLDTNAPLVCKKGAPPGTCGYLEPQIVGIIFDEARFKVEIFINHRFLAERRHEAQYFQSYNPKPSFILNTYGSAANSRLKQEDYNFGLDLLVGFENARLQATGNYSSRDQRNQLENLSLEADRQQLRARAGLFRTQTFPLIAQQEVLGVRVATTLQTRSDVDQIAGTELGIFLQRRSQIKIFRDNSLISTEILSAGNQIIDTRNFPEGAYEVTIEIAEVAGSTRVEKRFFVKSFAMPPVDTPLYYAEVGYLQPPMNLRKDLAAREPSIHNLGASYRLFPNLGAGFGLMGGESQEFYSAGTYFLGKKWRLEPQGMLSNNNDRGVSLTTSFDFDRSGLVLNGSRLWVEKFDASNAFQPIKSSYTQASTNYMQSFSWGSLNLKYQYRKNENEDPTFSYGPRTRFNIYRKNNYSGDLSLEASWDQKHDYLVTLLFEFTNIFNSYFSNRGNIGSQYSSPTYENKAQGEVSLAWQDVDKFKDDWSVEATARKQEDQGQLSGKTNYSGIYGRWDTFGESYEKTEDSYRYGTNFSFSVAGNGDGFGAGGYQSSESAVLIRLDGSPQGADFDIYVNGSKRSRGRIGSTTLLPLTGYQSYDIAIQSVGQELTQYKAQPQNVTLFPGQVVQLKWEIERVIVLVARLVDKSGKGLEGASLKMAKEPTLTGADGWLQVELSSATKELNFTMGSESCKAELPALSEKENIFYANDIVCR